MLDGILGKLWGFQKGRVVEAIGAGVDQSRSANFLLWTQKGEELRSLEASPRDRAGFDFVICPKAFPEISTLAVSALGPGRVETFFVPQ